MTNSIHSSLLNQASLPSRIVLACSRVEPLQSDLEFLAGIADGAVNWLTVIDLAEKHGVLPLLYLSLRKSHCAAIPSEILQMMKVRTVELSRSSFRLADLLKAISHDLGERGISVVAFKGPELAERYYGDVSLRQFSDVDLWGREEDVVATQKYLTTKGFEACPWRHQNLDGEFMESELFRKLCFEYAYIKEPEKLYVDLHWNKLMSPLLNASEQDLQSFVVTKQLWGENISVFSDEFELILASVHGCKHAWSELHWIVDIGQMITTANLDWSKVTAISRRFSVERMTAAGLYLAQQLLAYPLPEAAAQFVKESGVSDGTRELLSRAQLDLDAPEWKELKKWLYCWSLKGSLGEALQWLTTTCSRPTLDEWRELSLPAQLFPLYYLLRPVNLMLEHMPRILTRLVSGGYDKNMNVVGNTGATTHSLSDKIEHNNSDD